MALYHRQNKPDRFFLRFFALAGLQSVQPFKRASYYEELVYSELKRPEMGFVMDDQLIVLVEIRNTVMLPNPLPFSTEDSDMTLINLEILKDETIESRLNNDKAFGIASTKRKRTSLVLGNERIQSFCEKVFFVIKSPIRVLCRI